MHDRNRLLVRITPPVSEPLSLAQAKLYLRVDHSADDTLISDLITAARGGAETWLRRSLMTQSWKLAYDDYIPEMVMLPMGPVNDITSISAIDRDGTTSVVDDALYYLNAAKDTLVLDSDVFSHRVEIVYSAGYGDASDVPPAITQGLLAHIAAMYDARGEAETDLPTQAIRLYAPFRMVVL